MTVVFLPLLLLDGHGAGWAGLGWISVVLPYVIFGLPAGRIGDRINRKLLLLAALLLATTSCILLVLSINEGWPAWTVLLCGVLIGIAQPFVDSAVFGALSGGKNHREKLSFAVAGGPAGRVLGALLLSAALFLGGNEVAALVALAVALIAISFCLTITTPEKTSAAPAEPRPWKELFSDRELVRLITSGVLWNLLAVFLFGGASAAVIKILLGWSADQVALLIGIATFFAFCSSMLSPRITSLVGPRAAILRSTGATIITSTLFMASVALGLSTITSAALLICTIAINQIYITNLMVERQQLAPPDSRSSVATASRMITWLGAAAGAALYSFLIEWTSAELVGWMCCLGALLVWLLMIRWWGISSCRKNPVSSRQED